MPAYYPPMPFPPRVAQQQRTIPPYGYPGMRSRPNFVPQFSPMMRLPQAARGYPRSMPPLGFRSNPYRDYRLQRPMRDNYRQWPRVSAGYPYRPVYNQWRQPLGAFRQYASPYQMPSNRAYRPRGNFYPRHGVRYPMPQPQHRQMSPPPERHSSTLCGVRSSLESTYSIISCVYLWV
jgi:hypothetical protein